MRRSFLLAILTLLTYTPLAVRSATHIVRPDGTGDFPTIQDAINATISGDTILLAPGTFTGTGNKNLDPAGKDLVIASLDRDNLATIHCQLDGRAFHFHSGETERTIIEHIRFWRGYAKRGGAILCENASPTLRENVFELNCAAFGGAVCLDGSETKLIRNYFIDQGNYYVCVIGSYPRRGGVLYAIHSRPTFVGNRLHENKSPYMGIGIVYLLHSEARIVGNTFNRNGWSFADGGGVYADSSDVTIVGNSFIRSYGWLSGAIGLFDCSGVIESNYFSHSSGSLDGGAVYFERSAGRVRFNYIDHCAGGGVDWLRSSGRVSNNIIAYTRDASMIRGVGLDVEGAFPLTEFNTFYENEGSYAATDVYSKGWVELSRCLIVNTTDLENSIWCFGRKGDVWPFASSPGINYWWGTPMAFWFNEVCYNYFLWMDPLLCDPEAGNYFLQPGSPLYEDSLLAGALPVGCGVSDVLSVRKPRGGPIPAKAGARRTVGGFGLTNISDIITRVNYRLWIKGRARLDDNGDPFSLVGTSPVLAPGETWTTPEAAFTLTSSKTGPVKIRFAAAFAPALNLPDTLTVSFHAKHKIPPGQIAKAPGADGVRPLSLDQNAPNPFNPTTRITFHLPGQVFARLAIYNVEGRLVRVLADGVRPEGNHTILWDGTNNRGAPVASGVYVYALRVGATTLTRKLLLLR